MTKDKAMDDFHHKIEHYKEQYEPINPKLESRFSYIKVFNGGECPKKKNYLSVFDLIKNILTNKYSDTFYFMVTLYFV